MIVLPRALFIIVTAILDLISVFEKPEEPIKLNINVP